MRHKLAHAEAVAHHKAVKAPFAAKYIAEHMVVARRRYTVVGIKRGHKRKCPGIFGGTERRQVSLAEFALGHIGGIIVASGLGCAVGYKMLGTRCH